MGCLGFHTLKEACKGVFFMNALILFLALMPMNQMCVESPSGIQVHHYTAPPLWLISVSLVILLGPLVICLCTLDLHLLDIFLCLQPSQNDRGILMQFLQKKFLKGEIKKNKEMNLRWASNCSLLLFPVQYPT